MLLRSMVLECFKARLSAAGTADSSDGCALTEDVLPLSPSPTVENVVNSDPERLQLQKQNAQSCSDRDMTLTSIFTRVFYCVIAWRVSERLVSLLLLPLQGGTHT
jgi:hypothetical protein